MRRPRWKSAIKLQLPVLAAIAVIAGTTSATTVIETAGGAPGFDRPSERAAALHLPKARGLADAGFGACAVDLGHRWAPACFARQADADRYISGAADPSQEQGAQQLTLSGTGGVALAESSGVGYAYARTCEYSDCVTAHVLTWYHTSYAACTHAYPADDSYANFVDHGYVKLINLAYGSSAKNCNVVGIYPSINQGGGGAFLCYTATCGAFSGRYNSFSLQNS